MSKQAKPQDYQIKPKQKEKFRSGKVKEIIKIILNEKLKPSQTFEGIHPISRDIADTVKLRLKELNLPRYKFIVQVMAGEQKGQGVKVGGKNFWDFDTDYCVSETYLNDNIFCLVNVYGVYLY